MRLLEKYRTRQHAAGGEKHRYKPETALYCMYRWRRTREASGKREYELFWMNMFGLCDDMALERRKVRR